MFKNHEQYSLVHFNTERQWVTIPAPAQDPAITVQPFIAELELLKCSFERALKIYKGEDEEVKNDILVTFPEKEEHEAEEYMRAERGNDEYVWNTLIQPIISPNHGYSIHSDAPTWHKRLMKIFGFLTLLRHEAMVRNDIFSDFRDVALSCRVIADGSKTTPALSYGRMWRMYEHYRNAYNVFSCKAFLGNGYRSTIWSIVQAIGSALTSRATGDTEWFKDMLLAWDYFVKTMGSEIEKAVKDLEEDIAELRSGEVFSHTHVLSNSSLGFVSYFRPRT